MGGSAMVGVTRFERSGAKRSDGIAIADRGWRDMEISRHDRVTISNSLVTESRGRAALEREKEKRGRRAWTSSFFSCPKMGGSAMVGVTRFELAASWTPFKRATKLRHTPMCISNNRTNGAICQAFCNTNCNLRRAADDLEDFSKKAERVSWQKLHWP